MPDSTFGFISGETIHADFAGSLFRTLRQVPRFGGMVLPVQVGAGRLWYGRNALADVFLETNLEWLVSVDTDVVFEPEDIRALYATAAGVPCISAGRYLIPHGSAIISSIGYWRDGSFVDDESALRVSGMGFVLIHRDVFAAVGRGWYDPIIDHGRVLTEDLSFCLRASDAGFPVLLARDARPGHIKPYTHYAKTEVYA